MMNFMFQAVYGETHS